MTTATVTTARRLLERGAEHPVVSLFFDLDPDQFAVEVAKDFGSRSARYVRLRATGVKTCPDWHPGAGGKAWIFVDELVVR